MLLDKTLMMSDAQALTSTGAAASTNVIDFGADADIAVGTPIEFFVQVVEDFDSAADNTTLALVLQADDNSAFSSAKTLVSVAATAQAALVAGATLYKGKIPYGGERYMRVNYTIGTADATAGKVTATLALDVHNRRDYPDGRSTITV